MSNSWWRRLIPFRFYRSAVVKDPKASGAWYFEWRGRGWHIEAVPVVFDDWKPAISLHDLVEARANKIYDGFAFDDPGQKPAWVPNGNSMKQDEARRMARLEYGVER